MSSDWAFKPSELFPKADSSDFFSPTSTHTGVGFYGAKENTSWAFSTEDAKANESKSSVFSPKEKESNWAFSGPEKSESWAFSSGSSEGSRLGSGWLETVNKSSGFGWSNESKSQGASGDAFAFGRSGLLRELEEKEKSQSTQENWHVADSEWHFGNVSARLGIMDDISSLRGAEQSDSARYNWGFESSSSVFKPVEHKPAEGIESSWAYSSGESKPSSNFHSNGSDDSFNPFAPAPLKRWG